MNKRITSFLLVFVLILSMLVTAVPAFAEDASTCTYTVEADKTTAYPGDTIKFTIYMQQTGTQNTMEGTVVIPEGLTFVAGSGVLTEGIKTTLGWDDVAWTPVPGMILNGYGSVSYSGTEKLALLTFECTVDNDAEQKDYKVDFIDLVADDENYDTKNPVTVPATVTVTAKPVAVTGITLNKNTLTLTAGSDETLIATVEPSDATNKSVSWSSSDPSVATVADGKVTALKKGTTTITAETEDGKKTATCTVTVNCAHTNTTPYAAEPSTCKVQGHAAYTKCNDCGEIISGSDAKLPLADHSYGSFIAEVAATHTSDGVKGHYTCSVCGKNFDADKNELTSLIIAKDANHGTPDTVWKNDATNHWHECKVVGCGVVIDSTKAAHTFEWKTDKAATEEETGLKHEECTVCGYKRNENTVIDKLDHTHNLTHTAAVAATCKDTGNIEYWKCSKCGKFYSDAAAANEITEAQTVAAKDPANHVGGTELKDAKDATCYEAGYTGDTYCKGCGVKIADGTAIDKLAHTPATEWKTDATNHWHECTVVGCGVVIDDTKADHTFEWKTDKAATEEETGLKHEECTVCGYKRNENTVIDKLDHTHNLTHTAAVAATCKDMGNIEYWHCSKCGKYYSDAAAANEITEAQTVTAKDPANHVGETEIKDAKEATCTEEGYTGDTYCKSCGAKLSDGTKIDAKGHTFEEGKCIVCGADDPDYKPTEPENPKTGDNSMIYVWLLLLSGSGMMLAGTIAYGKKRKRAE